MLSIVKSLKSFQSIIVASDVGSMLRLITFKDVSFIFFQLWIIPVLQGVPIRLAGFNSNQCSGRVEIFHRRTWGTVCDDLWDLDDAMVVCRQLGCGLALSAPGSGQFGAGTGPIWLDNVNCSGSEMSLTDCQHSGLGEHDCGHDEDAGVVCSGFEIRLAGAGLSRCSGRVEIFHNGAWGTICDDNWDLKDADLVCRQLDCGTAVSAPAWAHFGQGSGQIWLDQVSCSGKENSLIECQHAGPGQSDCGHQEDAGVICSAASVLNVAPSGTASQSGTHWIGVASLAIDGNRNPNYPEGSCSHTLRTSLHWWSLHLPAVYRITHISITNRLDSHTRINNSEILIGTSLENNGNENPRCTIIDTIESASTRTFNCGGMIGQIVNVKLSNTVALTLCELEVYGEKAAPSFSAVVMGRSVEVVQKKLCWSDALFYCRDFYWDLLSVSSEEEQRELEKVLGNVSFPLTTHVWLGLRRFMMADTWFWMSGDSMNFDYMEEGSLWRETSPCGGIDTSDHFHWKDFPCDEHVHFICLKVIFFLLWILPRLPEGVPIRLAGLNSNQCSGRVEIFHRRTWGTVCDDLWDLDDAMVVCRQLGCGAAQSVPLLGFGAGTGPIWLDEVSCSGSEMSLTDCQHSRLGEHDCGHLEDAGVVCSGFEIRLAGAGLSRCSGRVEIFHDGAWGTICDDDWDLKDADLVCRQLDCGTAVSAPAWAHFGQGSGQIWLDQVSCSGRENSLIECQHAGLGQSDCGHKEDAGVICSAASVLNVAPSGTASHSGTDNNAVASLAIDGNKNPNYPDGSCTHTSKTSLHWWSLHLPAVYRITHISITNRRTSHTRINNAEILIGTSPDNNGNENPRCTIIDTIDSTSTRTFNCGGMIGQFVNVKLRFSLALTLCELEVYGEKAAPSFSAVVMGRSVEVVQKKLCWSDALFYCRDFYWDLLSVSSEEEQRELEKVLENVSFPLTTHVWLGLRRFLTADTWFWMSGDSMNFDYMEEGSFWRETSPCGGIDTSDHFHWKDFPCDEHVHFICLKDFQDDDKRVEFFSSTRP